MSRFGPHTGTHQEPKRGLSLAGFNSISTRIVASVFLATVLTAAAVSALCIRGVHADLERRLVTAYSDLFGQRQARWETERREHALLLQESSRPGSDWHGRIEAALAARALDEALVLRWTGDAAADLGARPSAEALTQEALPEPPAELALAFDRLVLVSAAADPPGHEHCPTVGVDVRSSDGGMLGHLLGCIARDALAPLLAPGRGDLATTRVLLTDMRGVVVAGAGPGAPARVGGPVPIGQLIGRMRGELSRYSDATGRALVGLAGPLGRSGFYLAIESEHARAFEPAIRLTRTIFILDVCVILLFSVLAFKVTVAIMAPIHALSSGAQRILEGQIDHQIPAPAIHDDELGLLTHTFNEMMRKLRANQIEIERDRVRLGEKNDELQSANEVLSQLSITDGLTKLHNHRYFQDHLTREIKRVSRTGSPLALILIDIDDFKQLNDAHGHAAGDEVLISLASIMNESARESDLIARYGGEEFVILMPNTDLPGAVHLAEKIRMAVESTRLIIGDRLKPVMVTISLGVALYKGNRREFFAEADRALYRAKAAGKNCVIISGSDAAPLA